MRNPSPMLTVPLHYLLLFTFLRLCALTNLTTFASWGCFSRNDRVLKFHSYDIRPAAALDTCTWTALGSQACSTGASFVLFHDHAGLHSACSIGDGYPWRCRCVCCHNDGLAHSTSAKPKIAVNTGHAYEQLDWTDDEVPRSGLHVCFKPS